MKPVGEEAVEAAGFSAPTKPQTEGHQASTGEMNGFISPSEETPPALQISAQGGAAAPPKAPPGEPATTIQAPLERPSSLQDSQHPQEPAALPQETTQPQPQVEHPPCLPTNGFSLDSTETSVISPSSLSDSDLLEAALDYTPSLASEKLTPEEPADISVNVQIKQCPLPNTDHLTQSSESNITGDGKGETSDKISHLAETVGREEGREERKCIIVKTSVTTVSEGIEGCDVPDGLEPEPSVSEAVPPSLKPAPKKQSSLFKRNKKKSNQGNLFINLNKAHVWNASLLTCLKGKSLFALFLLHLTFYILCMGYFSVSVFA